MLPTSPWTERPCEYGFAGWQFKGARFFTSHMLISAMPLLDNGLGIFSPDHRQRLRFGSIPDAPSALSS